MGLHYHVIFVLGVIAGYFFPKLLHAVFDNDLFGILSDCAITELRSRGPRLIHGWRSWASLAGAGICEASAAALCYICQGSSYDSLIPLGFLVIIAACARYFGSLAGVLGSISSGGTFAVFLFVPVGRLAVTDSSGRIALAIMVIGGIVLSYCLASTRPSKQVAAAGAGRQGLISDSQVSH